MSVENLETLFERYCELEQEIKERQELQTLIKQKISSIIPEESTETVVVSGKHYQGTISTRFLKKIVYAKEVELLIKSIKKQAKLVEENAVKSGQVEEITQTRSIVITQTK